MDHDPIQQYYGETRIAHHAHRFMLADTRYGRHFEVTPRRSHFVLFAACAVPDIVDASTTGACC